MKFPIIIIILFTILSTSFLSLSLNAQSFLPQSFQYRGPSHIYYKDGRVEEVLILTLPVKKKLYVKKINYRFQDERKFQNVASREVDSIKMKATDFAKSLKVYRDLNQNNMARTIKGSQDWEAIIKMDSIYYEEVKYDPKSNEILLAQVINKGFDSKLKVFNGWKKIKYIVKTESGETYYVNEKNYKSEVFPTVFKDCAELMSLDEGEIKLSNMAEHVWQYENCNQ